jgi:hypothetical protein
LKAESEMISLFSLSQGRHQSDPEKIKSTGFLLCEATKKAWSGLLYSWQKQIRGNARKNIPNMTKLKIFTDRF